MIEEGLRLHGAAKSQAEVTHLHELFFPYYAENIAVLSRPFEGVPALLDVLSGAGVRLAVCTNKLEALSKSLLRQLALDHRFAVIAGRDTFNVFKPAPATSPAPSPWPAGGDRAVMVGDSEVDFATAAAAGIPSSASLSATRLPRTRADPGAVIDTTASSWGAGEGAGQGGQTPRGNAGDYSGGTVGRGV